MTGSAPQPALPPDIRHALSAAAKLIAGVREECKRLKMQVFTMNFAVARRQTSVGLMRYHRKGHGWEDEIAHCSPWFTSMAERIEPLLCENYKASKPLQDELLKVARGWAGGHISNVRDGVLFAVGSFILRDFPSELRKLVSNRTTPFKDDEIIAIADRYEAMLDSLDAEVVREAKLLAVIREREAMLAPPAEDYPLSERQYDALDAVYALKAFSPDTRVITDDVAGRLNLDAAQLKEPISALVGWKLLSSKKGRGGGVWLTETGRKQIETQRKR